MGVPRLDAARPRGHRCRRGARPRRRALRVGRRPCDPRPRRQRAAATGAAPASTLPDRQAAPVRAGGTVMGTFAEQLCVWAPALVRCPTRRGRRGAARVRRAHRIQRGQASSRRTASRRGGPSRVIGAAGGLGHYAVQIATAFGYRVVGVDVGEERLEFVRSLGAEHVVSADEAAGRRASASAGSTPVLVFAARVAGFELGSADVAARRSVRGRRASRRRATATSSSTRGDCSSRPDDHLSPRSARCRRCAS